MKKSGFILIALLLAGQQLSMASIIRTKGLANSALVVKEFNNAVNLFNLNNPSGLLQIPKNNYLQLNTIISNDNHVQSNFTDGVKVSEEEYTWANYSILPKQDNSNTFLYWLDDKNVIKLSSSFNINDQTRTSSENSVNSYVPGSHSSDYFFQAIYAVEPVEMLSLGIDLAYHGGIMTAEDIEIVLGAPVPTEYVIDNNETIYSLFNYNLGISLDLPIENIGNVLLGLSFRPYDQPPVDAVNTILSDDGQNPIGLVSDVFGLGLDVDLAGGYNLTQSYRSKATSFFSITTVDVENTITPQGNIIAFQNQCNVFENHSLGLSLDLLMVEHQAKKEVQQRLSIDNSTTSVVEEGKSADANGLDFNIRYYGFTPIANGELRLGSRIGLGSMKTTLFDFTQENPEQLGYYETYPTDVQVGVGYLPIKPLLIIGEFSWNSSSLHITKLELNNLFLIPVSGQTAIQNSKIVAQNIGFKLASEYTINDLISLRLGYNYTQISNTYDIKDENNQPIPEFENRTKAGTPENPNMIDNALTLGMGLIQDAFNIDVFVGLHFITYDPEQEYVDNGATIAVKHDRFASEFGAAFKLNF